MAIKRTIQCDVCGEQAEEQVANDGWLGWGALNGIALNGVPNPSLCPACLSEVANFVDKELRHGMD